MVETSPQLWICRLRRIKGRSWQVMIWCCFTLALSLKPALAPSDSPVSHHCQPFAFASPLLLPDVGAWRGHSQSAFSFFFLQFPCNVLGPAVSLSHTTCQWRLRKDLLVPRHLSADLLTFEHPWSCSRAGGAASTSCSAPLHLSPGANSLQPMEQGGGKAWTREIRWQEHCTPKIPFPKCPATGRWYPF